MKINFDCHQNGEEKLMLLVKTSQCVGPYLLVESIEHRFDPFKDVGRPRGFTERSIEKMKKLLQTCLIHDVDVGHFNNQKVEN